VPCHGETHNAETEESDFGHVSNPGVFAGGDEWAGRSAGDRTGLVRSSKQVRRKVRIGYNRPCIMKGNARIWRAGIVLC
jgi:hypothetical protein